MNLRSMGDRGISRGEADEIISSAIPPDLSTANQLAASSYFDGLLAKLRVHLKSEPDQYDLSMPFADYRMAYDIICNLLDTDSPRGGIRYNTVSSSLSSFTNYPESSLKVIKLMDSTVGVHDLLAYEDLDLDLKWGKGIRVKDISMFDADIEKQLLSKYPFMIPTLYTLNTEVLTDRRKLKVMSSAGYSLTNIDHLINSHIESASKTGLVSFEGLNWLDGLGHVVTASPVEEAAQILDGSIQSYIVSSIHKINIRMLVPYKLKYWEMSAIHPLYATLYPIPPDRLDKMYYYKSDPPPMPVVKVLDDGWFFEDICKLIVNLSFVVLTPTSQKVREGANLSSMLRHEESVTAHVSAQISSMLSQLTSVECQKFLAVYMIMLVFPNARITLEVIEDLEPEVCFLVGFFVLTVLPRSRLDEHSINLARTMISAAISGIPLSQQIKMDVILASKPVLDKTLQTICFPPGETLINIRNNFHEIERSISVLEPFGISSSANIVVSLRDSSSRSSLHDALHRVFIRSALDSLKTTINKVRSVILKVYLDMRTAICVFAASIPPHWLDVDISLSLSATEVLSGLIMPESISHTENFKIKSLFRYVQQLTNNFYVDLIPQLTTLAPIIQDQELNSTIMSHLIKEVVAKLHTRHSTLMTIFSHDVLGDPTRLYQLISKRALITGLVEDTFVSDSINGILATASVRLKETLGFTNFLVISPKPLHIDNLSTFGMSMESAFRWFMKVPPDNLEQISLEHLDNKTPAELVDLLDVGFVITNAYTYNFVVGSDCSTPDFSIDLGERGKLLIELRSVPLCERTVVGPIVRLRQKLQKQPFFCYVKLPRDIANINDLIKFRDTAYGIGSSVLLQSSIIEPVLPTGVES